MNISYNKLLIGGICAIVLGIALLCYSLKSYSEIKYLNNKIDFEELDHNTHMPTNDKYYKYLSIGDFLNQKLEKNKNLPIKNTSCAYLDYSQHNMMSLYRLIFRTANEDNSRKSVVEGNLRSYLSMLDNYKTCRKYSQYKEEVQSKINEIEKEDNLMIESRMDAFLNTNKLILPEDETDAEGVGMQPVEAINQQQVQQESQKMQPTQNQATDSKQTDELIKPYLQ